MNKQETIAMMSQIVEGNGTKTDAEKYLNAFLSTLEHCVKNEDPMKLVGHFTMEFQDRAERQGQNPKTLEKITIPAHRVVKLKVGKVLSNLVQQ